MPIIEIIIIIYLYSLKKWHEYYNQPYTKNLHTKSLQKEITNKNRHQNDKQLKHSKRQCNS